MKSKKTSVKLEKGEALVVLPVSDWHAIADMYDFLADFDEYSKAEQEGCTEAAETIRMWVDETAYELEED